MSTARDGETKSGTLGNFIKFRNRLAAAHERALRDTNSTNQNVLRLLGDCQEHLELWQDEYIGPDGRKLRDIANRNADQASRIQRVVDEANELMQHCEFSLGMTQVPYNPRLWVTKDNCRDDCFSALRRTLHELQNPTHTSFAITAAILQSPLPPHNPSTPPAPSPRVATSSSPAAMSSSRVSPASYEESSARDDNPVLVKQEQYVEGSFADLQDRSHERKDSHLMPQHTLKEQPQDLLPPFSSFHPTASLAQIPSPGPYASSLLPRPSMYPSPSTNSAPSPQSPYGSSSLLNGHDQQTVMMSPSVLHPPLSIGPVTAMFPPTSMFYESRPGSKQSPSSPEQ